ncbi:MAG: PEP-CTERM sorting domain-containing protein [Opitutaceae bacterium]|nr:PEP-CTERM sorting domain-containing protein [Opitutaceae bacterium]
MKFPALFAASLLVSVFASAPVRGQTVALSLAPAALGANYVGHSEFTRGFSFTTTGELAITGLGWYDAGQDGLASSHRVGIWSTGGTLLVDGVVSGADPLSGYFRYTSSLTGSSTLAAGSYFIGGLSTNADATVRLLPASAVTFAPAITWGSSTNNGTVGVFSIPSAVDAATSIGYFGPNFSFAAIPEPSTAALLGGMLCLAVVAMRKMRRR